MFEKIPQKNISPDSSPIVSELNAHYLGQQICLTLSVAELHALTDLILNTPVCETVTEEMTEGLLRRLTSMQRDILRANPLPTHEVGTECTLL